ncbi:glycosyltransferase [Pseudoalteromonas piscicida]|uniref:Glycosyltransferase n=1 Tax=Pseudoalteromonas piscicida TaxID=43662 RepID=A0AAD0W2P4_PSEO7|nr:glycosyltransferase [Pseudoalteromonas piscicida]ASD68102.1 hypothetical protein B1L02_14515 [Pseudoalteromonas piscicida]AXR01189.1 glycosyltransferase [Pseudoalteromonas piscicida]
MNSICIATYNGSRFIHEQLTSILGQLDSQDEVIICDDGSTDNTIAIIEELQDPRVKIFKNPKNLGYVLNFKKSVSHASGDYIFLSDQDDVWPENRLALMKEHLRASEKDILFGNYEVFEDDIRILKKHDARLGNHSNVSRFKNIFKTFKGGIPYFGCCCVFKKNVKSEFERIIDGGTSHDIALSLYGNLSGRIHHIPDTVVYRRVHDSNVTSSDRTLKDKLLTRFLWLKLLVRMSS